MTVSNNGPHYKYSLWHQGGELSVSRAPFLPSQKQHCPSYVQRSLITLGDKLCRNTIIVQWFSGFLSSLIPTLPSIYSPPLPNLLTLPPSPPLHAPAHSPAFSSFPLSTLPSPPFPSQTPVLSSTSFPLHPAPAHSSPPLTLPYSPLPTPPECISAFQLGHHYFSPLAGFNPL